MPSSELQILLWQPSKTKTGYNEGYIEEKNTGRRFFVRAQSEKQISAMLFAHQKHVFSLPNLLQDQARYQEFRFDVEDSFRGTRVTMYNTKASGNLVDLEVVKIGGLFKKSSLLINSSNRGDLPQIGKSSRPVLVHPSNAAGELPEEPEELPKPDKESSVLENTTGELPEEASDDRTPSKPSSEVKNPPVSTQDILSKAVAVPEKVIGLKNTNNNCWINSLVQFIPTYKSLYDAIMKLPKEHTLYQFRSFYENYYAEKQSKKLDSQTLRVALHNINNEIELEGQMDAAEALRIIMGKLLKMNENLLTEEITTHTYTITDEKVPDGDPEISISEDKKSFTKQTGVQSWGAIQVELSEAELNNFQDILESYFSKEVINNDREEENLQYIECNVNENKERFYRSKEERKFLMAPSDLTLFAKRFVVDINTKQIDKLNLAIEGVSKTITLKGGRHLEGNETGVHTYSLDSFIIHDGKIIENGHYRAYTKRGDQWCLCNDDRVTMINDTDDNFKEDLSKGYMYHFSKD